MPGMRGRGQSQGSELSESVSFDEFKLYYESAEKVTERRLSANRWNYSVSTAVLITIGITLSWSSSHASFIFVSALGALFLSAMAFFFCGYWIKQIDDFKALNTAKFAVLEKMAPKVIFDQSVTPIAKSFEPFKKEWENMSAARALQPLPSRVDRALGALALKSTRQEYFLPQAFRALFVVIFAGTIVFMVMSRGAVFSHLSPFTGTGK
jgi:hypothetical protein